MHSRAARRTAAWWSHSLRPLMLTLGLFAIAHAIGGCAARGAVVIPLCPVMSPEAEAQFEELEAEINARPALRIYWSRLEQTCDLLENLSCD